MLKKIKKNSCYFFIKKINWKMFITIFIQFSILVIFSAINFIWLLNIRQEELIISSKWIYITIVNNFIGASIIFLIYNFICKWKKYDDYIKKSYIKICYFLIFFITIIVLSIINNFTYLFTLYSSNATLADKYISLKLWTILPQNIWLVSIAIFLAFKKIKYIYFINIFEASITFIFGYIFWNKNSLLFYSLMGDAYLTIIVQVLTAIFSLVLVSLILKFTIKEWFTIKWSKNLKTINKSPIKSSLNSFFLNTIYLILILKIVSGLHNNEFQLSNYNILNQLIWIWILIPIQVIAITLKIKFGNNFNNKIKIDDLLISGILILNIIIIFWILFIPLWFLIMNFMLNINKISGNNFNNLKKDFTNHFTFL